MTDINSPNPPSSNDTAASNQPTGGPAGGSGQFRRHFGRRGGRKAFVILALVGSFFAGGILFSHIHAIGDDGPMRTWMHHVGWAEGPGAHRPDAPPPPMTPAEQLAHARDTIDHALTSVDVTSDQRTKVLTIFDTAANELKEAPVVAFTTRLQIATILTAPTIDHDKLEALRASRVADVDTASKTVVKAVADAADVLSQDQRTRLLMMMEHMHHAPPPPPRG